MTNIIFIIILNTKPEFLRLNNKSDYYLKSNNNTDFIKKIRYTNVNNINNKRNSKQKGRKRDGMLPETVFFSGEFVAVPASSKGSDDCCGLSGDWRVLQRCLGYEQR
ncbi:hypothetical protein HanXRQr2_Chr10g0447621 [Helianthus annuus]|uniref:Uncharacterized protein n=1 Tax=Helianthus annuus TaxID=4232 RepID=A0A9K3HZA1_HELAN|nr:hypothetical protein HanXRQr2_Chr10g0447621 [Helianthus annuus]